MTKSKTKKAQPKQVPLVILANDQNPALAHILQAFYRGTASGQIGLVVGMDPDTGEVSPMLAGIEMAEGEIVGVYPIAKILEDMEQIERILIPDGQGNYVSNTSGFTEFDDSLLDGEAQAESGASLEQGETEAS